MSEIANNIREENRYAPALKESWETMVDKSCRCVLCDNSCHILDGEEGICGVRKNIDGKMFCITYGKPASMVMDLISRRPILEDYSRGTSSSLSIGLYGCNNSCFFCQNYDISQTFNSEKLLGADMEYYAPSEIVKLCKDKRLDCISFTFTEPLVWVEYVLDISEIAKNNGILICLKTAGNVSPKISDIVTPHIDMVNVDVKPIPMITECGLKNLDGVEYFLKSAHKNGCHIEISHLIIEDVNDGEKELDNFCDFISGYDVAAIHILRHYPCFASTLPVTKKEVLDRVKNYLVQKGYKTHIVG